METGSNLEDFNNHLYDLCVIYDQITCYAVPSIWLFSMSSLCINIPFFIWGEKNLILRSSSKITSCDIFCFAKMATAIFLIL